MKKKPSKEAFNLYRETVRAGLQGLAHHVHVNHCPPGWGFCVMMFEFGADGQNLQWVSNAQREDMIKSLREFAGMLEQRKSGGPGDDPESVL